MLTVNFHNFDFLRLFKGKAALNGIKEIEMGFGQSSTKKEILPSIKVQYQITEFIYSSRVNKQHNVHWYAQTHLWVE